MFTGLVQAVGRLERAAAGLRIRLPDGEPLASLQLGDSVAVDGVCLTVAEVLADGFRADVSEETLGRTTLGERASVGAAVNLEPALRLSDRLGGHLVSGHVDAPGSIAAIERLPGSWRLAIRWQQPSWGRYVCEKASIAVDGISLTVAGLGEGGAAGRGPASAGEANAGASFWMAVIPHTWSSTTLQHRRVGDTVNLEADLLAKYTERLLHLPGGGAAKADGGLDHAWLQEHGWS